MFSSRIGLLDHGYVRLVDSMGSDLSVVRAARVSYDADWRAGEDSGSDERLIRYLWSHRHTTPFEAITLTFEVKAPIFVLRQWHRHRTWSYNELSARYRELPEEFYVPSYIGYQSETDKQSRVISDCEVEQDDLRREVIRVACETAFANYRNLLQIGTPREIARTVLPVATYSHMFATTNLLNLFRFCTLRSDEHAQWEIRQYSNAMMDLAEDVAPVCVDAWRRT